MHGRFRKYFQGTIAQIRISSNGCCLYLITKKYEESALSLKLQPQKKVLHVSPYLFFCEKKPSQHLYYHSPQVKCSNPSRMLLRVGGTSPMIKWLPCLLAMAASSWPTLLLDLFTVLSDTSMKLFILSLTSAMKGKRAE